MATAEKMTILLPPAAGVDGDYLAGWVEGQAYLIACHGDDAQFDAALKAGEEICRLTEENAKLAAGSCDVPNGKIGDEHGHFYCTLQRRLTERGDQ